MLEAYVRLLRKCPCDICQNYANSLEKEDQKQPPKPRPNSQEKEDRPSEIKSMQDGDRRENLL